MMRLRGLIQLPLGFRIAPVFEYRSGFPYAVTGAYQNYVGLPYANRFPRFVSLDSCGPYLGATRTSSKTGVWPDRIESRHLR